MGFEFRTTFLLKHDGQILGAVGKDYFICQLSLIASRRLALLAKLRRGMNNVFSDMTDASTCRMRTLPHLIPKKPFKPSISCNTAVNGVYPTVG